MAQEDSIPEDVNDLTRQKLLIRRRSIILAITGCTHSDNISLKQILQKGYLHVVKSWLDGILCNADGSVDLLLHMLNSICTLPVTKEMVTSSKLGKQVASIEKHKICVDGKNEKAIKERVGKLKEMWSASVKRMKKSGETSKNEGATTTKRSLEPNGKAVPLAKKIKIEHEPKKSLLLSLIKKSSPQSSKRGTESPLTDPIRRDDQERASGKVKVESATDIGSSGPSADGKKKIEKKIKWADNDGGNLSVLREGEKHADKSDTNKTSEDSISYDVSLSDRKTLREKASKFKLVDKDDNLDTMVMMFTAWQQPKPLPLDSENPPVQVDSKEVAVQVRRMSSVLPVCYLSEEYVPRDPSPLNDTEESINMASQSSTIADAIPFFVPQEPALTPAPAIVQLPTMAPPLIPNVVPPPSVPSPAIPSSAASVEIVKAMGLPPFLAGQNIQALQTLAGSRNLLNAFVDVNGAPDQVRILNLVQTITQNIPPSGVQAPPPVMAQHPIPPQTYGQYPTIQTSPYQSPPQPSIYGGNQAQSNRNASTISKYRGDQNDADGNLHLSGYGPMTTPESIIALFAPYVKVDEIVPKNGFMFVNTNDPEGARRAREALNGVPLGGSALRINVALRRNKNRQQNDSMGSGASGVSIPPPSRTEVAPLPRNVLGQIDYNLVRDDRGNPATKNLFVAGYGQSTTEDELRELFNQHTQVTGVVVKGSFAFVNTLEKNSAVHAREALTGAVVKGGVLRINFAKESGRLGTSFDHGYAAAASRGQSGGGSGAPSYYGRSY